MALGVSEAGSSSIVSARLKSTKRRTGPELALAGGSAFAAKFPQPRRSDNPMRVELASLRHGRRRVAGEGLFCLSRVPLHPRRSTAGRIRLYLNG
jgi:hypothetical protein